MDLAQVFIFYLGWFFFAAWGTVLAAVSLVAFGRDIFSFSFGESGSGDPESDETRIATLEPQRIRITNVSGGEVPLNVTF